MTAWVWIPWTLMKKPGAEPAIPVLGRWRWEDPWDLLANQDAEIVCFRFSERPRLKQIKQRAPEEDF